MKSKMYFVEMEHEVKQIDKKITVKRCFNTFRKAEKYYNYILGGVFNVPVKWITLTEVDRSYRSPKIILESMHFHCLTNKPEPLSSIKARKC